MAAPNLNAISNVFPLNGVMAHYIDSIAGLTDLRDKDELEITLAQVMFELVGATRLVLWRLVRRNGDIVLRERLRLPSPVADDDEPDECLLADASCEVQACLASKLSMMLPAGDAGDPGYLFPISDGRDVFCLLEIRSRSSLRGLREKLIKGLLRIYRNHLGVLDYGDRDQLTGLLNRRTFDESFKTIAMPETSRSRKPSLDRRRAGGSEQQSTLAVIDIDFFKRINDQFGHPYGDEVLVLLARLMEQSFGDTDRLFRFGGEEFLVILAQADARTAAHILERFRASVEAFAFPQVGQVTISIGFSSIVADDTGSNAFGRADEALYVAKHKGRNQIRCYESLVADGTLRVRAAQEQELELF